MSGVTLTGRLMVVGGTGYSGEKGRNVGIQVIALAITSGAVGIVLGRIMPWRSEAQPKLMSSKNLGLKVKLWRSLDFDQYVELRNVENIPFGKNIHAT